jgi:ASC-1-like (ASCH) protein
MREVRKKISKEYFDAIASGKKTYEFRLQDFEVEEGDVLILVEWDMKENSATGKELRKEVTYVGKFDIKNTFWKQEEIIEKGIQIISFK